ncbi:cytochrome P450 [Halocatena pleomorpha]|uniref:Cytochrome P450 n=1 Tax=Halocatena pleomorpha TaxID=1785090 RepID=A0A3P3RBE8_9EURY|nr:cytochrome P450 [Halocatena pleomorpha]RRJ29773.1 cytochrome P450 [Halocatena pleomorpha]
MGPSTDGRSDDQSSGELPPQLDGLPLIGSTLDLARDPIAFLDRVAEQGDVVRYEIGGLPFTGVLHPEYVEQLLVTESESVRKLRLGDVNSAGNEFAPEGVLFTEGEQWRNQRIVLQNVFTPDRIERYGTTMTNVAARRVESWDDGAKLAINRRFSVLTLSILAKTLFDLTIEDRGSVITAVASALNEQADSSSFSTYLPAWIPTPARRRYDRAVSEFETTIHAVIEERRSDDAQSLSDRDDLLSLLLATETQNGYRHSESELQDQLLTFLFAGHEATSLALTYTVLLVAQHPAVASRLHKEWTDVLGDSDPTAGDVAALAYTDHVVRESLRLYPPAFAVFRTATEDISLGDYVIPEETNVTIPQFRVHRDPRWWDDPEAFDPDRWEESSERPEYAYFPFGGGPRHCIGMRFAMMELKLLLPTILRRVEFELLSDPDPALAPQATLQPAEDVRTRVRTRPSLR